MKIHVTVNGLRVNLDIVVVTPLNNSTYNTQL